VRLRRGNLSSLVRAADADILERFCQEDKCTAVVAAQFIAVVVVIKTQQNRRLRDGFCAPLRDF